MKGTNFGGGGGGGGGGSSSGGGGGGGRNSGPYGGEGPACRLDVCHALQKFKNPNLTKYICLISSLSHNT